MAPRIRALLGVLVVIVAATAGSLLWRSYHPAPVAPGGLAVATTGDLGSLFSGDAADGPHLAAIALRQLEGTYYKPVDPQTLLTGERSALNDYLRAHKIGSPSLPPATATGQTDGDANVAANEIAAAERKYGAQLGPTGSTDISQAALRGMLSSLKDPYTVYLSPREKTGLNESLDGGNFGGVGVYIYQLKDGRVIAQPIDQLPASRAGMKPGEVIDRVESVSVRGLGLDRVEQLIRGAPGTVVHLSTHNYNAPAKTHVYAVVREIIHVPTVRAKMEDGFSYIRLSDFGQTSADEVRKAMIDGQNRGAKGYILDLRDNGGGFLQAAVKISSLFVAHGTIVSTIARDGSRSTEEALGTAIAGNVPVVILVNKYTASASEITAGALQDYRLATLIGSRTFGKGVVQSITEMPDRGALKITTARYVTPLGRDIQHRGIPPDITVDQSPDPGLIDTPNDKQLAAAKAHLRAAAPSSHR